MDKKAIKLIQDRETAIRDAYEQYLIDYQAGTSANGASAATARGRSPAGPSKETQKWAWGLWTDRNVDNLVWECLLDEEEREETRLLGDEVHEKRRIKLFRRVRRWCFEFLQDDGTLPAFYDCSGFAAGHVRHELPWGRITSQISATISI